MREAMLYDKMPGSAVRCHVCLWRCFIRPGKVGVCGVRENHDGTLYITNYGRISSMAADPIEKKPLFHFFPGTRAFSLGGWGCNFHCVHCQNWEIACALPESGDRETRDVSPEESIELAREHTCQGLAWTYNEPTIWLEYTLDSARLAKAEDLYTCYVTNGFITEEALDAIGPYLDAFRVDVKGFSDAFYRELARVIRWQGILEAARRAKDKWNMHVEVITNIIPTLNDDEAQLTGLANWIAKDLGENTPWHVTRFHPQHHLRHLPATPLETLEHAYDLGRKAGLHFVYVGNVHGHHSENTVCYSCRRVVVQRMGYQVRMLGVEGSKCKFCGAELNIRQTARKVGGDTYV